MTLFQNLQSILFSNLHQRYDLKRNQSDTNNFFKEKYVIQERKAKHYTWGSQSS